MYSDCDPERSKWYPVCERVVPSTSLSEKMWVHRPLTTRLPQSIAVSATRAFRLIA